MKQTGFCRPTKNSNNGLFHSKYHENRLDMIENIENADLKNIEIYGERAIFKIPIKWIEINEQVRNDFDEESIEKLAKDIQENDLLHPITVMQIEGRDKRFKLLLGEQRLRAFKMLGIEKIPSIVKKGITEEGKISFLQLSENIKRKNLNPIETAEALDKIKKGYNLTQKELADKVGLAIDTIKKYSQINKISVEDKLYHFQNKSSFDKIMSYISKKSAVTALPDNTFNKSITGIPLDSKSEQLSLFTANTQGLKMKSFTLNFKKDPKEELANKIRQCEDFIKAARLRLSKI
jgi:ParB/RepB/Spo0J family partition protein